MKLSLFVFMASVFAISAQAKTICAQGALLVPEAVQNLNQQLLAEGVAADSVSLSISNPQGFTDFETICASFSPIGAKGYRMQVSCGVGVSLQDASSRLNSQIGNAYVFASTQSSAPSRREFTYVCAGIWQ